MRYLFFAFLLLVASCGGQTKEEMVREGDTLLASGNLRGSIVLYRSALEKDANFLDARIGLAGAYRKNGQLDRAEKELQKILLQNPGRVQTYLDLASVYINQNQNQKALLELDNYHSDNPETAESLVLYGRAYAIGRDFSSAESSLIKAQTKDPQAVDPYYWLARVYFENNHLDKAEAQLRKAISLEQLEPQAYYLLGRLLARQGKVGDALAVYEQLLETDPKQLEAYYMATILQMDMGQQGEAAQTLAAMEQHFSGRPETMRLKGMYLYRQGDYEGANTALESSIQSEPHILAYLFSGLSYYQLEQYELALNQFQKTLDLNPEFARGRILVATTLLKQKRIDDAIVEIQKALRSNPDNAHARNILGSAYLAQGDYDRGMEELEAATDLDPSLADAHFKRGLFHLAQGDGAEGESDLIKAIEAAPEVLNSRLMLVTHYLRQKNYSVAIKALQEGMTGEKTDALLNNYLAAAFFAQKKNDAAIDALLAARKIDPAYLTPAFNLASYYASQSRYDEALAQYESVLSQDDENIRALLGKVAVYNLQGKQTQIPGVYSVIEQTGLEQGYYIYARYLLRSGKVDAAATSVATGLQSYPDSVPLLELQGGLALNKKDFGNAQIAFEKMAGVNPEKGYSSLVHLYLLQKQPDEAEHLVQGLLQEHPDQDYPYLLASGLLISQGKLSEAQEFISKGQSHVADTLRLDMQLARVLEANDQRTQAVQLYQRIIQKTPRFAPAHVALGYLNEQSGNKSAALDLYRKAVTLDQNNVSGLNNLAYLLADNFGEVKEGLDFALKAYRLEPNDPRIMDTLGYLLMLNDKNSDAVKLLAKAYKMLPQIPTVALHYGQALMGTGEKATAKQLLETVVKKGSAQDKKQAQLLLNK